MKKRIRTNRMRHHILILLLMVGMGLGIWISCSKDAGVSSQGLVSTKPAVTAPNSVDFHPQTNVNYDPFAGLSLEDTKAAIGGSDAAEKYLQVIVRHLALVMSDDKARSILNRVVPKLDDGAIHLSQIAIEYPHILNTLSGDFKDAVSDKAIGGELSQIINSTLSDGEAILQASKALFDLELSLVTSEEWDATEPIPVFYAPLDDNAIVMVGMDTNLNPITFSITGDSKPQYSFLLLNFDEDLLPMYRQNDIALAPPQNSRSWWDIMYAFSLTSPAYAHFPPFLSAPVGVPHDPCYHEDIIQPVNMIIIYNDHEPWWKGAPEIYMGINWPNEVVHPYKLDLPDVDKTKKAYTNYAHKRTHHGVCGGTLSHVFVSEDDFFGDTDDLGDWFNVSFSTPTRNLVSSDVYLRMVKTTEDLDNPYPN